MTGGELKKKKVAEEKNITWTVEKPTIQKKKKNHLKPSTTRNDIYGRMRERNQSSKTGRQFPCRRTQRGGLEGQFLWFKLGWNVTIEREKKEKEREGGSTLSGLTGVGLHTG